MNVRYKGILKTYQIGRIQEFHNGRFRWGFHAIYLGYSTYQRNEVVCSEGDDWRSCCQGLDSFGTSLELSLTMSILLIESIISSLFLFFLQDLKTKSYHSRSLP
jgi:hypothetical protein